LKIFSFQTNGEWLVKNDSCSDGQVGLKEDARNEIKRVLSDAFRSQNLIVLTGLGTSLHINIDKDAEEILGHRVAVEGRKIAPTMTDLWEKVKNKSGVNFSKVLSVVRFPQDDIKFKNNIEALLSYSKVGAEFADDQADRELIKKFISETEEIIRNEINFLAIDDDVSVHSELLRRIARRSSRKVRTKIFTTNYDLCFEYAARQARYVVIDGFSHTVPQVFDSLYFGYDIVKRDSNTEAQDFISNVFHLYKLHGSIDWQKNEKTNEIEKVKDADKPILIYPRNTKYELAFEQPYLEMMSAFQTALRQPETALLVVGFGFNDNHLAEPIISAIKSNLNLKVVICDPYLAPREKGQQGNALSNEYLKKINYLIKKGDARLSFINATFEDLVPELPDIAADTDLELHLQRINALRVSSND
jgi:hypothetical protein